MSHSDDSALSTQHSALIPEEAPSPCINVCRMDNATGLCIGCCRTLEEISGWLDYTIEQKKHVLDLVARRKRLSEESGALRSTDQASPRTDKFG